MTLPPCAEGASSEGKRVCESSISISYLMLPQDANPAGHIHGGVILKHIDTTGGVVAMRHVRGNAVTASIDRVDFLRAVYIGELVHFKACINMVGRTSMEIGVRVEGENLFTGEIRHTATAYLTYVSLDANSKPQPAPPLVLETDEERRRNKEALTRRALRIAQLKMEGPATD